MIKVDCNTKKEHSWNPSIDKFLRDLVKQNTVMFNSNPRVDWNNIFFTYQRLWESLGIKKAQQLQYRSRTQAHLSACSSSSLSASSSASSSQSCLQSSSRLCPILDSKADVRCLNCNCNCIGRSTPILVTLPNSAAQLRSTNQARKSVWTEEADNKLYTLISRYEKNKRIQWTEIFKKGKQIWTKIGVKRPEQLQFRHRTSAFQSRIRQSRRGEEDADEAIVQNDATSVKKHQPRKRRVVLDDTEDEISVGVDDSDDEGSVDHVAIVQNDDATSVKKHQPRKRRVVLDDTEDEGTVVAIVPNDHATSVQHNIDNKQTRMFWSIDNLCCRITDSKGDIIEQKKARTKDELLQILQATSTSNCETIFCPNLNF